MEEVAYDIVNDYYNYIYYLSPISHPTYPLDHGGSGSYEDCVWQIWMSENYTPQIIVDLFDWRETHMTQPMMDSYEQILNDYGTSLADAWANFTAWNYATGYRAINNLGYDEASDYPAGAQQANFSSFPAGSSGSVQHLAANFIRTYNLPTTPGDVLRIQFDGEGADLHLTAVVERRNGTGLIEVIPLDEYGDAIWEVSVPVNEMQECGLVVSNSAKSGANQSYSISVDVGAPVPVPELIVDTTSINKVMAANQTDTETIQLSNDGEPGSVLNYTIEVMDTAPVVPAKSQPAASRGSGTRLFRDDYVIAAENPEKGKSYPGDCVFGNTNSIFASTSTYWMGNENYAFFIRPSDYTCSCTEGFNVRAVHMWLDLQPTSNPEVRAHLAEADGTGDCLTPGAILASTDPIVATGDGFTDVEIPCDFACEFMGQDYFLIFEFMDANGPVNIPFDFNGQHCYSYCDQSGSWSDLVADEGFFGNILIWADVDCCDQFDPEVTLMTPNGGENLGIDTTYDITWVALSIDDLKIEVSRDGGGQWETIVASTPNDGSYSWMVTGPPSTDCLVKVGTLDDSVTDISNSAFVIYQPADWLTTDPSLGAIPQGGTHPIDLNFDTADMWPDTYDAYVVISHDALGSPYVIPVTLTVQNPNEVTDTPYVFQMAGNFPNPFNPQTTISFTLGERGPVTLQVMDLRGRLVRTVWQGELSAGPHHLQWDGRDAAGQTVAAGTYVARLQAEGNTATSKMVLSK
jgi:hypothetical protein